MSNKRNVIFVDKEGVHWRLLREGFAHKCKDCMFRTQDDKMKEIVQVIYIYMFDSLIQESYFRFVFILLHCMV